MPGFIKKMVILSSLTATIAIGHMSQVHAWAWLSCTNAENTDVWEYGWWQGFNCDNRRTNLLLGCDFFGNRYKVTSKNHIASPNVNYWIWLNGTAESGVFTLDNGKAPMKVERSLAGEYCEALVSICQRDDAKSAYTFVSTGDNRIPIRIMLTDSTPTAPSYLTCPYYKDKK